MLDWKVYYGDQSTFSSDDGPPSDAPSLNMQVIVQRTVKEGYLPLDGADYYWWDVELGEAGEWTGGDIFGLYDHLQRSGGHGFGRTIKQSEFDAIKRVAHAEARQQFPPKSLRNIEREGRNA